HPRNAAVLRPEDKMHRIVVLKPPGTAIVAKHSVSHHFIDVRQIPADKIDRVAQSSVKPFERRFKGPWFLEEPPMVSVVIPLYGNQLTDQPRLKVLPLAHHRFKKSGTLSHKYLPPCLL